MKILYDHSEWVENWVRKRIPHVSGFGRCVAVGVVAGEYDRLIAGVVYHDIQLDYRRCEISCAADDPRWARPHIVSELLEIPFMRWNVYRAQLTTPSDSHRVRKFVEGIGFTLEGIAAAAYGEGKDAAIYRLLKPEWLQGRFCLMKEGISHGQIKRSRRSKSQENR